MASEEALVTAVERFRPRRQPVTQALTTQKVANREAFRAWREGQVDLKTPTSGIGLLGSEAFQLESPLRLGKSARMEFATSTENGVPGLAAPFVDRA